MSNVIAGVARGQMEFLEEHIQKKAKIYERYKQGLEGLPAEMNPWDDKNSVPNFWMSCLLIDRKHMCSTQRSERKVIYKSEYGKSCPAEILETLAFFHAEGRPVWKPMHMQNIYKNNGFVTVNGSGRGCSNAYIDEETDFDVGADIFDRGVCLPSDIKMSREEQERIIEIIRRCFW